MREDEETTGKQSDSYGKRFENQWQTIMGKGCMPCIAEKWALAAKPPMT